ncbi:MAG: hypothetical protein WCA77_08440, partial [Thermoplasmata archaeon]
LDVMPTYLILWETRDRMLLGTDPEHQLKLIARMVDVVNEQMHSGVFREIRTFTRPGAGYAITGDISGDRLHDELQRISYEVPDLFQFEIHELTSAPTLETLVKGLQEIASSSSAG